MYKIWPSSAMAETSLKTNLKNLIYGSKVGQTSSSGLKRIRASWINPKRSTICFKFIEMDQWVNDGFWVPWTSRNWTVWSWILANNWRTTSNFGFKSWSKRIRASWINPKPSTICLKSIEMDRWVNDGFRVPWTSRNWTVWSWIFWRMKLPDLLFFDGFKREGGGGGGGKGGKYIRLRKWRIFNAKETGQMDSGAVKPELLEMEADEMGPRRLFHYWNKDETSSMFPHGVFFFKFFVSLVPFFEILWLPSRLVVVFFFLGLFWWFFGDLFPVIDHFWWFFGDPFWLIIFWGLLLGFLRIFWDLFRLVVYFDDFLGIFENLFPVIDHFWWFLGIFRLIDFFGALVGIFEDSLGSVSISWLFLGYLRILWDLFRLVGCFWDYFGDFWGSVSIN